MLQTIGANLGPGQPIYVLMYAALIIFFCFFYTALMFNSKDTADNLKRSGAFVPGIRPGVQTAEYIDKVLTRLTFWGGFVYRGSLFASGACTNVLSKHAVQFRWHVITHSRRRNDGLHVAATSAHDEPSIRRHDAESQPAELRQGWPGTLSESAA